jgi:hypothetical protein
MEIAAKNDHYAPIEIGSECKTSVFIQDVDAGDTVYIDRLQAEKLLPLLKAFAETGERPQ